MLERWFISYRIIHTSILDGATAVEHCNVVTDVSPVRWLLESQHTLGGERVILYAERITGGLAVELVHGGAGVSATYFRENS